jgi:uncharacterized membrane protein (UPF0127 family)
MEKQPFSYKTTLLLSDGTALGVLWVAQGAAERMRGLLGRDGLPVGELLLLDPCGSIHTFGMRFSIDTLFLDAQWRVVGVRRGLRPNRMAWGGWRARRTLEAASGWLPLEELAGARFAEPVIKKGREFDELGK